MCCLEQPAGGPALQEQHTAALCSELICAAADIAAEAAAGAAQPDLVTAAVVPAAAFAESSALQLPTLAELGWPPELLAQLAGAEASWPGL